MDLWSKFAELLKKNPWWGALGILLTLIFGILTIILSFKSLHTKEPVYAIQSTNLIQDFTSRFEALEIKYAGKQISNFTATKVAFWNNGKDTINGSDIASADPLIIRAKNGYKILESKVLCTKKDANQFKIIPSENGSHVLIQFDYLDKGEGGVIQLLHTGKSSDDVKVCGTVKGAGKPPNRRLVSIQTRLWAFFTSAFASSAVGAMVALLFNLGVDKLFIPWKGIGLLCLTTFGIMYLGFGFWLLKRRIPKGFEIFEKDI